jgi:Alginate lyase/Heparinase II/III-like protein
LGEASSGVERCPEGLLWRLTLRSVVAVALALAGVGMMTSVAWASARLLTGKPHPFVFVTGAEIDAAQEAILVRQARVKREAFTVQQARADRWLQFAVPAELPFDRQFGDAARDLAILYVLQGDDKYAAKAAEILRALANGIGAERHSTLHMAVRSLPIVFGLDLLTHYLGAEAEALQQQLLNPIVRSLRTRTRRGFSNQDVWVNAAVAAIGFLREDQSLVDWAVFDSDGGILRQIDVGIMGDGIWHERPLHYHFYTLQAFLVVAEAMARSGMGFDLYGWTSLKGRTLASMFLSPIGLLDPYSTLPGSGDSFGAPKIQEFWHYLFGWRRYGNQAFAWVLSQAQHPMVDTDVFATAWTLFNDRDLPEHVMPPEAPSLVYQDSGWMSLRSDESRGYWRSDAVQVLLSYGGGKTHDHADKLNIDISGLSERLVEDKSVFAYGDGGASPEQPEGSRHRLWDRQTVAHNTVVVDQRSQPGAQLMFQETQLRGRGEVFVRCGAVKVARASADSVYPGVRYSRQVALVASDYLVDQFRVESGASHVYDWVLHVNRPPDEQPRSDLTWRQAPALSGSDGYQMIHRLRRSHTSGPWSLEWPKMKIWMAGGAATEIFLGEGYGGPVIQDGVWELVGNPEPSMTPMVLARREAPGTVFAAVIELFETAPAVTRVEEIAGGAGISALRVQRPDRVDILVTRWDGQSRAEAVVDPLTRVTVPIGRTFTLAQVRGEKVQQWSDVGGTSADRKPRQDASPDAPGHNSAGEPHQCVNEVQGERPR